MNYIDFELKIERTGDHYIARVLRSPVGEASTTFTLPFSEDRLENLVLKVGRLRTSTRRIYTAEMEAARELGGKLFESVFSNEVRACLRGSLDEANRQDETGLRLKLRLQDVAELADLPWEFLFDPSLDRFFAQSNQTPIVRFLEMPQRISPLTVNLPLQVLVMISSPADYAHLDVEREKSLLQEALDSLSKDRMVQIEWLEKATLPALQRRLRGGTYHIFHFIGHGGFDRKSEEGVLVLEDEQGRGWFAGAHRIGTLLHDHRMLRLAVLNSCEGARNSRTDPFAGVATSLVRQGVPAVVAMQFEITDTAAVIFASEFYNALAVGYPVDAAVAEARKAIYAQPNDVEWGTPVLYMRSPDGVLFHIQGQAERLAQERAAAERLAQEKADQERLAREKAEAERIARERAEQERLAQERATAERLALEKAEQERLALEKAEQQRLAREKAGTERLAAEKAEAERIGREKAEQERLAQERATVERLAQEEAEKARLAAAKAEAERIAREMTEQERLAQGTAEAERFAGEKAEQGLDWLKRVEDGFEPIPFAPPTADRPYGYALAPIARVLLGKERIPFLLQEHESGEGHRMIEVHPQHAADQEVKSIKPAEVNNVEAIYVLLSAGDALRIRGDQRFERKEIGRLVIHFSLSFEQMVFPLRLGVELREWVSGETRWEVVRRATAAEEVWRSPDNRHTLDMIRVDIQGKPRDVSALEVVAECKWLPDDYKDALPSIRISGVTYKTSGQAETERLVIPMLEEQLNVGEIERLLGHLQSEDAYLRKKAAEDIARLGVRDDRVIDSLKVVAESDNNKYVRSAATAALLAFQETAERGRGEAEPMARKETEQERNLERLLMDLQSNEAFRRKEAAEDLARADFRYDRVVDALKVVAESDDNRYVRSAATNALLTLKERLERERPGRELSTGK